MALQGKWTRANIDALTTPRVRALRKNAARASDQQVIDWCDEVLQARETKENPPSLRERLNQLLPSPFGITGSKRKPIYIGLSYSTAGGVLVSFFHNDAETQLLLSLSRRIPQ